MKICCILRIFAAITLVQCTVIYDPYYRGSRYDFYGTYGPSYSGSTSGSYIGYGSYRQPYIHGAYYRPSVASGHGHISSYRTGHGYRPRGGSYIGDYHRYRPVYSHRFIRRPYHVIYISSRRRHRPIYYGHSSYGQSYYRPVSGYHTGVYPGYHTGVHQGYNPSHSYGYSYYHRPRSANYVIGFRGHTPVYAHEYESYHRGHHHGGRHIYWMFSSQRIYNRETGTDLIY